ncbi:hypothetical protein E2C01_075468 [Portunus trituberculatus]|uniref:Uncharacterized protein n=1 Tax=Portunus trituberculatus TaxID=210409 RepID=A0A5B7IF23_PORTR|nr:hypothetical protein [Portunus trituberculatus]
MSFVTERQRRRPLGEETGSHSHLTNCRYSGPVLGQPGVTNRDGSAGGDGGGGGSVGGGSGGTFGGGN